MSAFCLPLTAYNANVIIGTDEERPPISPYIYGTNQLLSDTENWSIVRQGGNRWTGYNWENNASSAGSDWNHYSDGLLADDLPDDMKEKAGAVFTWIHDENLSEGRKSIFTLQMAGYMAKDKEGEVTEAETAPSARWDEVFFEKPGPYEYPPDLNDGYVSIDEFLDFLVGTHGSASGQNGIFAYSLDNEPALWSYMHPRIHPDIVSCEELAERSIALSRAIKVKDPAALVLGPVLYGMAAFGHLQDAPDWPVQGDYE
jgi:hypothetical protein